MTNRIQNPGASDWYAAREEAARITAEVDAELAALTNEAIDLILPCLSKAKARKVERATPEDHLGDLQRKARIAWDAAPKKDRERLEPGQLNLGSLMAVAYKRGCEARARAQEVAAKVEGPILGDEWRTVRREWATYKTDAQARAAVTSRAAELREIGYEVRGVERVKRPPFRADVVWREVQVKTTAEGALIAAHQTLWGFDRTVSERRAAGCAHSPILNGIKVREVETARHEPIDWVLLFVD